MPSWFDGEVEALEQRTKPKRQQANKILFYGSSTFTLWSELEETFGQYNAINHGFGGSTLADCVEYFDRLVVPMEPRVVILYAGDNDLDNGASPEAVFRHLKAFIAATRRSLGNVPLAYVSIKVSPARFRIMHKIAYTNRLIEEYLAEEADTSFLDITRRMVSRGMAHLLTCYTDDPLHMNETGYRIWTRSLQEYLDAVETRTGPLRVNGGAPQETGPAPPAPAEEAVPAVTIP